MHKISKHFLFSLIICYFIGVSLSCDNMIAFASDGNADNGFSKGLTAVIMIALFIGAATAAAFISYKVKVRKLRGNNDNSTDKG
ncbi:hypothetical protein [Ruminococcus sp.]|uniref:hypothetical protein n=1 Tax=Ruminococcus sp. TaxID=41978 RepID=UPI0025FDEBDC|nr:hypothetical protein [Ruminococcus sp.]